MNLMIMDVWFGETAVFIDRMKIWEGMIVRDEEENLVPKEPLDGVELYWQIREIERIEKGYKVYWHGDILVLYKSNGDEFLTHRAISTYIEFPERIETLRPDED